VVVRADYYGHCAADHQLAELLAADQVLVGPMTTEELRRAIQRPAERAGLRLEAGLAEQLLADVAGEPGGLPLLSTALLESWQRRQGRTLTLAGYAETGGVKGAVARLAERAFGRLDPGQQTATRRLLLRLAGPGEGELLVGRRVPLDELDAARDPEIRVALAALTEARLLTTSDAAVEVAHEALLRHWPRLRGWLEEDAQGRVLHRHLTRAARDWQEAGRDPGELYRGARLAAALDWAGGHLADLNQLERAFLEHGRRAAEREVTEARRRAEREARSNRRLRGLLAGLTAVLVVAVVAAALAVIQQRRASHADLVADARRLDAQALVEGALDRSLLLAAQANRLEDSVDTQGALLTSLLRSPQAIGVLRGADDQLLHVAVSPDGRTLAAGDNAGRTLLWDTSTRRPLPGPPQAAQPGGEQLPLRALAFSPDGRLLITAGPRPNGGDTVQLWDLAAHKIVGSFDGFGVISMAVRRDGRRLAVGTGGGQVLLLDLVTRTQASPPLLVDKEAPYLVALSPDGKTLATIGSKAVLWDLAGRRPIRRLDAVGAVAFSPDGHTLAASHRQRGEILLLDPATGKRRRTLTGHTAGVGVLSFSHDGATLASAGQDGTAIVWDGATGRTRETLRGHTSAITGVAFSPDDRTLYTSSLDKSIIVWDLAGDRRLGRPFTAGPRAGSQSLGNSHSFGKGGTLLARAHDDGTVTLIDLVRRAPVGTRLRAHPDAVQAVALSSDGRLLATADANTATVWDLATRTPAGRPTHVYTGIIDLAISPDGRTLAIGDSQGQVTLADVASATVEWPPLQQPGPVRGVSDLGFSPDGTILAVAADSGEVLLWRVADRSVLHRLPADRADAFALGFTPDGRTLATGGNDGKVLLWNTRTGRPLGPPLARHAGGVGSVSFSPDGRVLAAVGGDGAVVLWDVASQLQIGAPLPARPEGTAAVAFLSGGRQLAAATTTRSVLVWDLDPAAWRAHACAVAGRTLTRQEWDEFLPDRPYHDVCPA
jgi:WD40 repeat protein